MQRIAVTDLDCYRYYKTSETMTLEEVLRQLRHQEPPKPIMTTSKALHKFLEHANESEQLHAEQDGERFYFHCEINLVMPRTRELKAEVIVPTDVGEVTLVGKCDGIDGAIHDWKLTERFDAERYGPSMQWRAYLMMFGAQKFTYHVFEGKQERDLWRIYSYHEMSFYAYPEMKQEVEKEVGELAGFLKAYG